MKKITILVVAYLGLFINTSVIANTADSLFTCIDKDGKKILLETTLKDERYIRVKATPKLYSTNWVKFKNTDVKIFAEGFSRGAQTVIDAKINNCIYLFEDSLIARNIGEVPAHDIVKKAIIQCKSRKISKSIQCTGKKDGASSLAYDLLEKMDMEELYSEESIRKIKADFHNSVILEKSFLFNKPNKPTKMYLIKGDKVTILDEQTDDTGQKWYFINYKEKKDLNMWIKAEAVNIEAPQQVKPTVKPKKAEPTPQTKAETPKPAVAKTEPKPSTPKEAEVVIAKEEATKTKSGSSSFPLLVSLLGLLAWRANA